MVYRFSQKSDNRVYPALSEWLRLVHLRPRPLDLCFDGTEKFQKRPTLLFDIDIWQPTEQAPLRCRGLLRGGGRLVSGSVMMVGIQSGSTATDNNRASSYHILDAVQAHRKDTAWGHWGRNKIAHAV